VKISRKGCRRYFLRTYENKGYIGKHHGAYIHNTGDDIYDHTTGDWGSIETFKMTPSKIHLPDKTPESLF